MTQRISSRRPFHVLSLCVLWGAIAAAAESSEFRPLPPASPTTEAAPVSALNLERLATADAPISAQEPEIEQAAYLNSPSLRSNRWGCWELDACARGYYINDQRIEWSGNEETFGAEAIIAPSVTKSMGCWQLAAEAEIYLNQPYDRNIFIDGPERASYREIYMPDVVEISELFVSTQRGDWTFTMGKFETPFGRTYFPLYTNARLDAPFIRTECVLWRETGARLQYTRGIFNADAAIANGSEDRDTNSMKCIVARIGLDGEHAALGCSAKFHDGVGSENQKQYKNHIGMDAMVRYGRFTLSSEAIYDEYGFHRPGFDPNDITWKRSIYYRDVNYMHKKPVTGVGYYFDLLCDLEPFALSANYGEYFPKELGITQHDVTQRRAIFKGAYSPFSSLQFYGACIFENGRYIAQSGRPRRCWVALFGLEWSL